MTAILNLIRWKNLLLILLTQLLVKYALLEPYSSNNAITTSLDLTGVILLIIATVCIAAAGYIINDIEDVEADFINKPNKVIIGRSISEKTATTLFLVFNIIGVFTGFILCWLIGKSSFFTLFVLASATLYIYATYLKGIAVIGNLAIALLTALSIYLVGIFDLVPSITKHNVTSQLFFLDLIKDYTIFAFLINFLRELIKDIEDIDGDHKMGLKNLPILIGRNRASKTALVFSLIPLGLIIYYLSANLYAQPLAMFYLLLFIIAPLLYVTIKLGSATNKKDFTHISTILKFVMLFGVLSLLLFQFILIK